ncbi:MAG: nucleotidyltransferase family protein [Planctomycetes bacterium]|nr:nucleotidyltransferase family protein [Planctomycetota bacterium]
MNAVVPYETRLNADRRWALMEGSMHFEKESAVFKTMQEITKRLDALGVAYAVVGGMALFMHGYRRFTEDVDILVTKESLVVIHERLEGLGYLPLFVGGKNLRDTDTGVKIEFLVSGGFPGDGLPKPVAFPDPAEVSIRLDGVSCASLSKLVELKLASGTAAWRLKDLADVQEMIRVFGLAAEFAEQLDPSVQASYRMLWTQLQHAPRDE